MTIMKQWNEHLAALERLRKRIDDMGAQLADSGSARRTRKSIADSWEELTTSAQEVGEMLTGSLQPLPVDFPWQDKEFLSHWTLYKEYMQEQHGIYMKSRMEQARLKQIREFCNGDRMAFIRTIDLYMALGTANVFKVEALPSKMDNKTNEPIRIKLNYD